jgi:hypothetical protein
VWEGEAARRMFGERWYIQTLNVREVGTFSYECPRFPGNFTYYYWVREREG